MQDDEDVAAGNEVGVRQERASDGIEQLRQILFGPVLTELERRIARTDAQHVARENDLKYEARRRVEIIESHLQRELASLTARVEREASEIAEAIRTTGREQREASAALDQRVVKLEEMVSQARRELRQEVLDHAKMFLDELEKVRLDFSSMLERRLETERAAGAAPDGDER